MIYDYNAFIADVGGYLGLLLGHSLLSIFYKIASWYQESDKCRKYLFCVPSSHKETKEKESMSKW